MRGSSPTVGSSRKSTCGCEMSARSTVASWKTTLLTARAASGSAATSKPARRAVPAVGSIVVVSIPIVVDFPAPFGPSSPTTSPAATSKSIPFTASAPPGYVLRRPRTSIAFIADSSRRRPSHRPHLNSVAYRMLGSVSEAEDAVQEAWLRLSRSDTTAVANLGGWLTTVVGRVCLDMLRARRARREEYTGTWLPEPIVVDTENDPEQEALLADSVGLALLVVLETLTPV